MTRIRDLFILSIFITALIFSACRQPGPGLDELNDENQILLNFSFNTSENAALGSTSKAVIQGDTVYISLPAGTDRTALVPRFEFRGKGLQVDGFWQSSGQSVQNFTKPVYYDLVRADDSRLQYTVIAGYGDPGDTQLYGFSFNSTLNAGIAGTVNGAILDDTILLTFPFESSVGPMIPSFYTPAGAIVSYNGQVLVSDTGPPVNPVDGGILKVDFAGGSTRIYRFKVVIEQQDFVYVSASAGSAGASGSQINPLNTLEEALTLAVSKNLPEIRVSAGTYTLTGNLTISSNITIRGGYSSGDWSNRQFESPSARSNGTYRTEITTSSSASGTLTVPLGTIIYTGSDVGSSSRLEGVVVRGGSGGNITCGVSVLNGAKPTILFSDILSGSTNTGAGAFVSGSSPSFFSSVIKAYAFGSGSGGIGLLVGSSGTPRVVSCYISGYDASVPDEGTGLQLESTGAGGVYYNNFIEGQGSLQGAAVKMNVSGGNFINNIFSNSSAMPGNFCFLENVAGARPSVLQNNNFSTFNLGIPLYRSGGSLDITSAAAINSLGYAGSSGNRDFRINSYSSYEYDLSSQMLPPSLVFDGQVPDTAWNRDLNNNSRTASTNGKWSIGALELDSTALGGEVVTVSDTSGSYYDGIWSTLDVREAVTLVNTWESTHIITYPSGSWFTSLSEPLVVTSDLYFLGPDSKVTFDGAVFASLFIIDDGDGSHNSDVFFRNVIFQNGYTTTGSGGAVFSRENLYMYDCQFLKNQAQTGGAVYQAGGHVYLANIVFDQNSTFNGSGGALYLSGSSLSGINLVCAGNAANSGAAVPGSTFYLENSPAGISHSTFLNNVNNSGGSGTIYSSGSSLYLINSIFYVNTGTPYQDLEVSGATLAIKGSIVESAGYVSSPNQVASGDPLVNSTSNPPGTDGVWLTSDDNFQLQSGSPAVNWGLADSNFPDWPDADGDGNTTESFPYDILKNSRVISGLPDAGAYESSY